MNYNERNRHVRDAALTFEAETHTYRVGNTIYDSVTTVVDNCFEQFDAEYWASVKATPAHTKEMILAEWAAKGEHARNLGTELHDRIERYYLGETITEEWLRDSSFRLFCGFACDIRLCPHRSEWRIYHEESRLAGTLDFLARRADGTFDIWDWKRSAKVVNSSGNPIDYNSYGRTGFDPVANLPDTTYHHYALQVSIYRYILESKYGLSVHSAHLGIFHPDYRHYHVVDLPYLNKEVERLFEHRIQYIPS